MKTPITLIATLHILAASICLAQTAPLAQIDGPKQVEAGRLAILRITGPESIATDWLIVARDRSKDVVRDQDWIVFDAGKTVVFATPNTGTYLVIAAVADKGNSGNITILTHELMIGQAPEPNPDPTPPDNPTKSWEKVSYDLAMKYVPSPRQQEAKAVAAAIREAVAQLSTVPDLRKARELVRDYTLKALKGNTARWNKWSDEIAYSLAQNAGTILDVPVYSGIMNAIANGLDKVTD
ncbi:MAG TPA: hypothetical protein P5244_11665 [Syntrophales bacterium]|nr:hypothetical protein [Methanothrix sp.]HON93679.1 hypothetical protein [Sedimentisphaerales bacterium]HRR41881.1 hypothetical protein [Syntrophales bacterium]